MNYTHEESPVEVDTYNLIKSSGVFSDSYYLSNYSDVYHANIDPLTHYIEHGADEFRNASENFHTLFYAEYYRDLFKSSI